MSDKPLAGLMAALAVAPLCLVCVLGPAALVAAGGSLLAWLGGPGAPLIVSVLAVGGWLAWRALQRGTVRKGNVRATEHPQQDAR